MEKGKNTKKLFLEYLNFLKKQKSCKKFRELTTGMINEVEKTAEDSFEVDSHASIFKFSAETTDEKVVLSTLQIIEECLAGGVLNGKGPNHIISVNIEGGSNGEEREIDRKKTLIDGIIQSICYCSNLNSEIILFMLCKLLLGIYMDMSQTVNSESLKLIFTTLSYIMSKEKMPKAQTSAKKSIFYIAYNMMQKLELISPNGDTEDEQDEAEAEDSYVVEKVMLNMVDSAELYFARREAGIENPPLFAAPKTQESLNDEFLGFSNLQNIDLKNEAGETSGKFGWCVVTRKPADYYCKETRMPVASIEAKIEFLEKENLFNLKNEETVLKGKKEVKKLVEDTLMIFKNIMNFAFKESKTNDLNNITLKMSFLEIIHNLLQNPSPTLSKNQEFIEFLRNTMFKNLVKNCTDKKPALLSTSLSIFFYIIKYFRQHFLEEISVFITDVIIPVLESVNNKHSIKSLMVKILRNIVQDQSIAIDFFVNYDCNEQSEDLLDKIIKTMTRIAQGKFNRMEYSQILNSSEEKDLRNLATQSLIKMIGYLDAYVTRCQKSNQRILDPTKSYKHVSKYEKRVLDQLRDIKESRENKTKENEAIAKFNLKIKHGLKEFIKLGIYEEGNADQLSAFFKRKINQFSKEKLGDLLGDEDEFKQQVLKSFTESFNFEGESIADAMRRYFTYFQIPGEAQKIERVVYQFAEKYSNDNPDVIDYNAACIFGFSLVMLQTNMYNANVLEHQKMGLESFCNQSKYIESFGEPLNEQYVIDNFNNIKNKPLAQHKMAERQQFLKEARSASLKKKEQLYITEGKRIMETAIGGLDMIQEAGDQDREFRSSRDISFVMPLLNFQWTQLYAFFSILIENCNEMETLNDLNKNAKLMIKLADTFELESQRDAFIFMFVQFSGLDLCQNRLLTDKNLAFLLSLLELGVNYPNNLHKGWKLVINSALKLEWMLPQRKKTSPRSKKSKKGNVNAFQENINKIFENISYDHINRVYSASTQLDNKSLKDFFHSLCELIKEMKEPNKTIGVLQKISETLGMNISREMKIWTWIWPVIYKALVEIVEVTCTGENLEIADMALDTLKQLSRKLLLKTKEEEDSEAQGDILEPFKKLSYNPPTSRVRRFIGACMLNLVQTSQPILKGGWITIFEIFTNLSKSSEDIESHDFSVELLKLFFSNFESNIIQILPKLSCVLALTIQLTNSKDEEMRKEANEYFKRMTTIFSQLLEFDIAENCQMYMMEEEQLEKFKGPVMERMDKEKYFGEMIIPAIYCLFELKGVSLNSLKPNIELGVSILIGVVKELNLRSWDYVFSEIYAPFTSASIEIIKTHKQKKGNEASQQIVSVLGKVLRDTLEGLFDIVKESGLAEKGLIEKYLVFLKKNVLTGDAKIIDIFYNSLTEVLSIGSMNGKGVSYIKTAVKMLLESSEEHRPTILVDNKYSEFVEENLEDFEGDDYEKLIRTQIDEPRVTSESVGLKCIIQTHCIKAAKKLIENLFDDLSEEELTSVKELIEKTLEISKSFNRNYQMRILLSFNNYLPKQQIPSLFILEIESSKALQSLLKREYERKKDEKNYGNLIGFFERNIRSYIQILDQLQDFIAFEKENMVIYGDTSRLILEELRMWIDRHHDLIFTSILGSLDNLKLHTNEHVDITRGFLMVLLEFNSVPKLLPLVGNLKKNNKMNEIYFNRVKQIRKISKSVSAITHTLLNKYMS